MASLPKDASHGWWSAETAGWKHIVTLIKSDIASQLVVQVVIFVPVANVSSERNTYA